MCELPCWVHLYRRQNQIRIKILHVYFSAGDVKHLHGMFDSIPDETVGDVALAAYSVVYAYAGGWVQSPISI